MATRFYLPSSGAADVSPAFDTTNFTNTSAMSPDRIRCVTARKSTALTDKSATFTAAANKYLTRQYVSDPIGVVNFNSTTFSLVLRCLASTGTTSLLYYSVRLYHTNATFATLVGAGNADTNFPTTQATRIVNAVAASNVSSSLNDRIVIEIGFQTTNTVSTSFTQRFGDNAGSDFALTTALTTDLNPWAEFSATVPFASIGENRVALQAVKRASFF